jgi:serpin B
MPPNVTRRTLLRSLAAVAAAGAVGSCAAPRRGGTADAPALLTAKGVTRARPAADAPVDATSAGMAAFGAALCRATAAGNANWVASPLSIACAFSMVRAGATGDSATQLDRLFGFPAAGRDQAFNAITRDLVTAAVPPAPSHTTPKPDQPPAPPVVCIGNALFPARA